MKLKKWTFKTEKWTFKVHFLRSQVISLQERRFILDGFLNRLVLRKCLAEVQ